ncbi:DUF5325 family protein [Brevibacillus massiliensis]|jgi:high-affinity Fe2+/Pb2+ permease|uniref:DUF5325 family protein n=1 Tax=Brevibacillus massiliensis TaxID=1118054 RepID=UPI0002F94652|nr:DUF5325 family protein [Brevibacillus massiliensis]
MNRYQAVTLALAVGVAFSLVGIGIAIGEQSVIGIFACLIAATALMGGGFMYKRKHNR